ncbi:MAG: hypothetical protein ACREM6_12760 [Vulcanimicrobiaceae bacterium]
MTPSITLDHEPAPRNPFSVFGKLRRIETGHFSASEIDDALRLDLGTLAAERTARRAVFANEFDAIRIAREHIAQHRAEIVEALGHLEGFLTRMLDPFVHAADPVTGKPYVTIKSVQSRERGDYILSVVMFDGSYITFSVDVNGQASFSADPSGAAAPKRHRIRWITVNGKGTDVRLVLEGKGSKSTDFTDLYTIVKTFVRQACSRACHQADVVTKKST